MRAVLCAAASGEEVHKPEQECEHAKGCLNSAQVSAWAEHEHKHEQDQQHELENELKLGWPQ